MKKFIYVLGGIGLLLFSCNALKKGWDNLNLFPVAQDIELGKQVSMEIESNQAEFPVVPEKGNEVLYNYVKSLVTKILSSGKVNYANDFPWKITLINDINTLNAFATPGGYIYIYTGLLKFLDSEDQLAGVLGHEIAHAANRHSTKQLSKILGVQVLADASLGKQEVVKQVATTLLALSFSRAHETDADSMSVIYLCNSEYNAAGASGFFKKMQDQPSPPTWMSTHPNPKNRIENIDGKQKSLGCTGTATKSAEYAKIKALVDKIPGSKQSTDPANKTESNTPLPANDSDKRHKKIEKPGGK